MQSILSPRELKAERLANANMTTDGAPAPEVSPTPFEPPANWSANRAFPSVRRLWARLVRNGRIY
ncbi:hypothetical protein [Chitinimonas naiadis]